MNAVTPGDYVQFFASFDVANQSESDSEALKETGIDIPSEWKWSPWSADENKFVIGSIPSQDDSVYYSTQDARQRSEVGLIGIPNHFGMLSEGGVCLRRFSRMEKQAHSDLGVAGLESGKEYSRQLTTSRMDVPYGIWKTTVKNVFEAKMLGFHKVMNRRDSDFGQPSPKEGLTKDQIRPSTVTGHYSKIEKEDDQKKAKQ